VILLNARNSSRFRKRQKPPFAGAFLLCLGADEVFSALQDADCIHEVTGTKLVRVLHSSPSL
jgi:hypothetical protein